MADQLQQVVERLVEQLADILALTSGRAVRTLPAVGSCAVDWQVPLTVDGVADTASVAIGLTAGAAQRLTAVVLGEDAAHPNAVVGDTIRAIVSQAAAAVVAHAPTVGLEVAVPVHAPSTPPASAWQHDLLMDDGDPPRLVVWQTGAASIVRDSGVASVDQREAAPVAPPHRNLDVLLDLELPITVRFGATRLTLDALARLGPGSVIDLERAPDDPVDLLVNGRLVARGEVVVVSGCYGVRVQEVVSAADRLRSLEG